MLLAYARFIVRHSYVYLFIVAVVSTILTVIPFIFHELPSFSDPIAGFETRGTVLGDRFIAWENLIEETRPSRSLAVNPKEIEDQIRMNKSFSNKAILGKTRSGSHRPIKIKSKIKQQKKKKLEQSQRNLVKTSDSTNSTPPVHVHYGYGINVTFEDENSALLKDHTRKQWISLKEMQKKPDKALHHNIPSGTCGSPVHDYAHLVISTSDNTSLLSFENVMKLCKYQSLLVELGGKEYHNLCQRSTHSQRCCPVWSVPNYFTLLAGKYSCFNLTEEDVNRSIRILSSCAPYFHNFTLMSSCDYDQCNVPKYCSHHNVVYNLLFFMMDSDAFASQNVENMFVKNAMLFFPLPCSSTVLPYYKKISYAEVFSYDNLRVCAIDFGLRNALFDLWIIQDTWLVGLGGVFVFVCVWVFTKSLLLTMLLFVAITYSLGIAYFLYVYILNLNFFPFMNLLVTVVVIGIGADDAFLYKKVWKTVSKQLIKDNIVSDDDGLLDIKNMSSAGETILVQIVCETIKHSGVAIFITTLTTAVAFFASYVSYIPAINCFSVFAGTAVLVNFILMITWLPASVYIVDVKMSKYKCKRADSIFKYIYVMFNDIKVIISRFIVVCVIRLNILLVLLLGAIGVYSIIVVFYYPGLRLPDSRQFQLFDESHFFEQYDLYYKDRFLFDNSAKDFTAGSRMPLRWIWGIKAIDNGNHMEPSSQGHLVLDNGFSVSDPASQVWLLNFCALVKGQSFYQHTLGPLLPNCFIETFKMFMSRRCVDSIDKIDRTPCCEVSKFPYKKEIFDFCIIKAMESLYQTPRALFMPGVAGPKFSRTFPPKVVAIVIEFESVVPYSMSYTEMEKFYSKVENWTQNALKNAPRGLQNGWFLSDLQFYDLQNTLANGTVVALLLSASLGFVVLIPSTKNLCITICALFAIIFSCTVTIAILVFSEWKLNVLESVVISTSAGLAVDFSLHYALSYVNSVGTKISRVKNALNMSAGPTAGAALTTGFAGIFLIRSNLLPYVRVGTFLAIITVISWTYATFFLCSLLCILGKDKIKEPSIKDAISKSGVNSVCSAVPNLESHELERLAKSNGTNLTHSQSPSSVSAITVVLHDEIDNVQATVEEA